MFSFSATYIALWAIVLFQGLLILAVMRQLGDVRAVPDGSRSESLLPIGTPAPPFSAIDRRIGGPIELSTVADTILLFIASNCPTCRSLLKDLQHASWDGLPSVVGVCQEHSERSRWYEQAPPQLQVIVDEATDLISRYRIASFPTAVIVDSHLIVRLYGHPDSAADLRQLYSRFKQTFAGTPAGSQRQLSVSNAEQVGS